MYQPKSTQGEETPKYRSQIDAPEKKKPSRKPPNCSNTNFSLHLDILKNHASKLLEFSQPLLFQCDQNQHSNLTSH